MQPLTLIVLAATLSGCGLASVPRGVLPAFEAEFEDRVWREANPDAPSGAIRAFLSDGTMLTASCAGGYRMAPWRRVDATTLVWEDGGEPVRAEIAAIGPRDFILVLDPEGTGIPLAFERAEAPVACS